MLINKGKLTILKTTLGVKMSKNLRYNMIKTSCIRSLRGKLLLTTNRFYSSYSSIQKLRTVEEYSKVISDGKLSVIDFYATWCGPCKAMIPHISKLIKENSDVNFYKVDVDESSDLAIHCQVNSMPTFIFAKDSKLLDKVVGANPPAVENIIKQLK